MLEPKPAYTSEPPPPPVPLKPSRPPKKPLIQRPMTVVMAAAYAFGTTLFFHFLAALTVALRPAAATDLVNGFVCQLVAYLAGFLLILRLHAPEGSIREILGFRRTHVAFYPLGLLLGLALVVPVNSLYDLLERRFPSAPGQEDRLVELLLSSSTPKRVVLGVIIVVAGPLLEEVFFRGALLSPLRRAHPIATSVLVTAGLFAIAHESWQMWAPIAVVGIALGLVRVASASLVPSFLLHATFNAVPFYSVLASANPEQAGKQAASLPAILVSTALAAVIVYATRLVATKTEDAVRAQENDNR
jgi:membrane protease YdiL (CAAX protease family)